MSTRDVTESGSAKAQSADAPQLRQLSQPITTLLSSLRSQIRALLMLDGIFWAIICCFAIFWIGAALDYLPVKLGSNETPKWVRIGILGCMGVAFLWAVVWRWMRRTITRLPDHNLAVLLERKFPQLNSRLVTVVELHNQPPQEVSNPAAYQAMLARTHESTTQAVQQLDLKQLLNWQPVQRLGWVAGLLLVSTLIFGAAQPSWARLWMSRLFALSDERWPRHANLRADGVQIQLPAFTGQLAAQRKLLPFDNNIVQVPKGGSVVLNVSADTQARRVPELCTLFYQLDDGSRGRANMRRLGASKDKWQPFMLDGPPLVDLTSNMTFDVVGGDARLDDLQLLVVDPAVVVTMQLELAYPEYLIGSSSNRASRETLEFRNGQRIPQGTEVSLKGKASADLSEVQYVIRMSENANASTPANRSEVQKPQPTTSDVSAVQTGLSGDVEVKSIPVTGSTFTIPLGVLESTAVVEVRLIDRHGLTADQIPRYVVTVAEDTTPEVAAKLDGIGSAITAKALLPIIGSTTDDHGLARTWATIVCNEQPPKELDIEPDSEGKIRTQVDLLKLGESGLRLAPDSTLGLVVSAADKYNLNGLKHVGTSQPFQLAIVTEDKLLNLLERQELELRQRLELIISELTQLRDVLRELGRNTSVESTEKAARIPSEHDSTSAIVAKTISFRPNVLQDEKDTKTESGASEDEQDENAREQARRLNLLRAQQSVLQGDKSQQELIGVATRVEDIRKQLVNNRTDSIDRQERLQDKVHSPLRLVLANEMEELRSRLTQLQSAAMSPAGGAPQAVSAAEANDKVLVALDGIVANLMDLASYNEVLDLVRGILEDEERLLDETQKKQKSDVFDLLNK